MRKQARHSFKPGWHPMRVDEVKNVEDPQFGGVSDRVGIIFEVLAELPDGGLLQTNERLCIFQEFNDENDAIEGRSGGFLQHLGVRHRHEVERLDSDLRGRRVWGQIGAPRKEKGFQPILALKPWEQRPAKVETRSPSDIISGLSPGWMATSGLPMDGMIALEPPAGITPIGPKADHRAPLNLTLEPLEAHEVRHPYVAKLVIDGGDRIPSSKGLGEEKLFFLYLFVTSGKPLTINEDEFTFITQSQAINSFREWAEAGYLVNRDENWKERIVKGWYAFRTSLGEIAALEGLFSSFDHPCDSQPCYAVRLRHNALRSNLPEIEQVLAIVRTRVKSRKGRGRALPLGSDSPGS
jgi:hypothetical protein